METLELPSTCFYCSDNTRMQLLDANGFRMETLPEGGGVQLGAESVPANLWQEFSYLSADVYHESHDVLVVLFSFTDAAGRSISVHYGVLPRVKTKICLPLKALNGEKLFLDRYPGVMQSVLRGDAFVDRNRIVRFSVETISSVTSRSLDIFGIVLSHSVPTFHYEQFPYIDEFGQWAGKDWAGKTKTSSELIRSLREEWRRSKEGDVRTEYGRYGGWKGLRFSATGYFRTEHDGQRWWLVDPDGYALFSAGIDCIHPGESMRVDGMEHLLPQLPNSDGEFRDAWLHRGYSFGIANLILAFGDEWREKWADLIDYRMKSWGMNTIGNWSSPAFIRHSGLPYVYPMEGFPSTERTIFRDFPDVFSPEYERNAAVFSEQLRTMLDDRRLIGYFMRNEPHWAFVNGLNLTEQMLRSPYRFDSKVRFVEWLKERHGDIAGLNTAWGSALESFEELFDESSIGKDSPGRKSDFAAFNRLLIRRYVEVPAAHCKRVDPNHLNLGMRYAWVGSDDVLEGCEHFDVFSVNCYQFEPARELIRHIAERLNKPIMIGEFHFGAADVGLPAYGIRAVSTQEERGAAYRYFVEQAASIPELIGVHYFQLNDQPVLGRFDGENYQIGVVDVCQQPYGPFVDAMKLAHSRMYEIRIGKLEATRECPNEIPKTGF